MFKAGDVVIHIEEPNRKMTVERQLDNKLVKCIWFDDGKLKKTFFAKSNLVLFERNKRYSLITKK